MNKIKLYPHNQAAFEKLATMREKEGHGALVQQTGTSKSFITLAMMNWSIHEYLPINGCAG